MHRDYDYLVSFPTGGHFVEMLTQIMERFKVGLRQVVDELLDLQHALLLVGQAVGIDDGLVNFCKDSE